MNLTSTTDTQAPSQPGELLSTLRDIAQLVAAEDVSATAPILRKVLDAVGAVEVRLMVERPVEKELVKHGEKPPSFTTTVTEAGVFTDEGTERIVDLNAAPVAGEGVRIGEVGEPVVPIAQLLVPLSAATQPYGMFVTRFDPPKDLTDFERCFIDAVAAQLSAMVYNDFRKDNLNDFIQTISHDLRNPLTFMSSSHEMLEQQLKDGQVVMGANPQTAFYRIKVGINQVTEIIQNVVDSASLDPNTGYYRISRKPIDIIALVNEIVQAHTLDAEMRHIVLSVAIEPDLPLLSLDGTLIKRAFNNLLDNAIKYSPDGSQVFVSLRTEDKALIYSVRDTGLGIPAASAKLIFKKYFRLKRRGQERIKGTGLGLFIVKQIAQKHNGDAVVQSEEGKGSTFTIQIPMEGENLPGAVASA